MEKRKKILIVDDSDIDREVLKSILYEDFDFLEAENGYTALELILKRTEHLDAILLDVSMPVLDGFSVLRLMQENHITNIPIFMITAEATPDNVEKAARFHVSEFIGKPFDREEILRRLKGKLGFVIDYELSEADITETNRYIANLESMYEKYLRNFGLDASHYRRMVGLVRIMLSKYSAQGMGVRLDRDHIEIISQSAYFCDIGNMLVPNLPNFMGVKQDEKGNDLAQSHTTLGMELIRVNPSRHCEYFVQVCSEMCRSHHERYDGEGYPARIYGKNNSIYGQMCGLADRFDTLFSKYRERNDMQFEFVISDLAQDRGAYGQEIFHTLADSKFNVVMYYKSL